MIIDLQEHRKKTVQPVYTPRRLVPRTDTLPVCVALERKDKYIALYEASQGWIGQDKQGYVFNITVTQTGIDQYSCECLIAEPVKLIV